MPSTLTSAKQCSAVLFDLDGTLADTGRDLAAALNRLRAEEGQPALPYEAVRKTVSDGTPAMLGIGFGVTPDSAEFASLRERFLALYATALCEESALFPGMQAVLDYLQQQNKPWGIVTNKPGHLTRPLMERMALQPAPACIVSGDDVAHAKPAPDALLRACELANIESQTTVYVGDASRDIEAAKAAGMFSVVASWGYIADGDDVRTWQADAIANSPTRLLKLLG